MESAKAFDQLDSRSTNEIGTLLPVQNLEANHHDLFSFKTAERFSLPLSLIHVTHKCTLDEHKTWLCLLSNAYEIMNHLKSDSNFNRSNFSNLNFRIPLDVLRFKTDSDKRLKYVIDNLSNLKKARIQIDLLNRDGLRSLTSQFNFINDFTIKIDDSDVSSAKTYDSDSCEEVDFFEAETAMILSHNSESVEMSRSRVDYSKVSIVYNLPTFFNSIFLESNIDDLTHLFSWTNINSVNINNKKGGKVENLLYCLMESSPNEIELDFQVFKAYLGFGDKETEDRYIIRDSIKPSLKSFNDNEVMAYIIEIEFVRGKRQKISSIILRKIIKSFTNEVEAKIWKQILESQLDNTHRRVMLKQLMPKHSFDDLTNVDLDTITKEVAKYCKTLKKKAEQSNTKPNYIGACRAGFAKRYGIDATDSSSATIVGNESVVRAAKVGLGKSVGKNDEIISSPMAVNPLSKLSTTLHLIVGRSLMPRNINDNISGLELKSLKSYINVAHNKYQNNIIKVTGIVGLLSVTFPDFKVVNYDLEKPSLALTGYLLSAETAAFIYGKLMQNVNYISCDNHSESAEVLNSIYLEFVNYLEINYPLK